ncbi:hypothetical protein [Arcobacter sp. LA11]|uniref:hypothetical protein n=1 Tax=Arcobacter sp. LA11 TaxID=1898176 RepID=UPI000932F7C4|nr:hypothetical protein [Arcobacter sp. LA11]
MAYKLHKVFAFISFLSITLFFTSTLIVELFFGFEQIAFVKDKIVCPGLFILVPSIIITAISGNIIAKKSKKVELIKVKKKRMPIIAFNGVVILIPCAIYLNILASSGTFDTVFYSVQLLELFAGATNMTLMFMNIRDSRKA